MPGSTPDAELDTASTGTRETSTPSRAAIRSRRAATVATSPSSNPPRLATAEVDGSPGPRPSASSAVAEGRVWNHGSAAGSAATGSIPISDDPTAVPSAEYRIEPSAGQDSPGSRETSQIPSG
jgi:hypothetical protein